MIKKNYRFRSNANKNKSGSVSENKNERLKWLKWESITKSTTILWRPKYNRSTWAYNGSAPTWKEDNGHKNAMTTPKWEEKQHYECEEKNKNERKK